MRLREQLATLRTVASMKHRMIGLGLLRIGLGTTVLMVYVQHFRMRGYLWGNDGVFPWRTFLASERGIPSLYAISSATWFHIVLYLSGMAVSAAFTLGWRTRISSILFWLLTWSLYARNGFLLDGGDNIIYLLAFYMMFADCSGAISLDATRTQRKHLQRENALVAVLHNFALLAILLQLCLLYFTSGLFKGEGHVWQDGTAIYYILRSTEFNLSPLAHLFWRSGAVVTLLTWSTVIFEISWSFLIWFRKTRFWVVCGAVLLHAMIGYFMGLVWFSLVMISAQAVVFDDSEYRRVLAAIRRVRGVRQKLSHPRKWRLVARRLLPVALIIVSVLSIEAIIPAYIIYWTYTYDSTGWWLWMPLTTITIAAIVMVLPWCQFIPWFARPIVPLAVVVAAWHARGSVSAGASAAILLAAYVLIRYWLTRRAVGHEEIEISPPLASGIYFVGQGGGSSDINHHFRNESQRFALDILRLNGFGMRAWGFFPRQLDRYAIYGTQVLCPVDGVVTAAVDGFPDMEPLTQRDIAHIEGNHIVIRCAARTDLFLGLAHLLAASIQVRAGDTVCAGQPLARVGNSGNTTEPHLHIHAKTGGDPDSMLDGHGVPLRIRGRFLMRNDLFQGMSPKEAVKGGVSEETETMSNPEARSTVSRQ